MKRIVYELGFVFAFNFPLTLNVILALPSAIVNRGSIASLAAMREDKVLRPIGRRSSGEIGRI